MDILLIGKNIKLARELLGISQKDLANKLGLSWEMISRYENGRSNPFSHISEIAYFLSQNIEFFFKVNNSQDNFEKNKVPLFYEDKVKWSENYSKYDLMYSVPDWVSNRFEKLFALKLKCIKSSVVLFDSNEIGIFTLNITDEIRFSLYEGKIENFDISDLKKDMAGLIYIEKRFV